MKGVTLETSEGDLPPDITLRTDRDDVPLSLDVGDARALGEALLDAAVIVERTLTATCSVCGKGEHPAELYGEDGGQSPTGRCIKCASAAGFLRRTSLRLVDPPGEEQQED